MGFCAKSIHGHFLLPHLGSSGTVRECNIKSEVKVPSSTSMAWTALIANHVEHDIFNDVQFNSRSN